MGWLQGAAYHQPQPQGTARVLGSVTTILVPTPVEVYFPVTNHWCTASLQCSTILFLDSELLTLMITMIQSQLSKVE